LVEDSETAPGQWWFTLRSTALFFAVVLFLALGGLPMARTEFWGPLQLTSWLVGPVP
jgi:hypothetical protein